MSDLRRWVRGAPLLVVLACSSGPGLAAVRDSIQAGAERFQVAFRELDAGGVAALYSEDAMLLPPNAQPLTGRIPIRRYWEGTMAAGATGVDLTLMEVEAAGDLAVEVGTYRLRGPRAVTLDVGKYLVVWKLEGGRWLIFRDIWNTSAPVMPDTAAGGAPR